MERNLLFSILFFQDSCYFSKGIVLYLLLKRFRPYFWSSSGFVWFCVDCLLFNVLIIYCVLFLSCRLERFQLKELKKHFNQKHPNKILTPTLKEAVNQLSNNPDITIRTGDKTNIYIILNKTDYNKNIENILNDQTKF